VSPDPIRCVHVIVPEPDGSTGGADMHVRDLAAAQARRGTSQPVVFATSSHAFATRMRAVEVDCVSTAGQGRRAILPALRQLMVERQVEIVHSHGYDATWWALAALATLRRRAPLVVTCHGWIETTAKLRVWSALDRCANRLAKGVIVVSDELVAPAVRDATRARVFALVPNGVLPGRAAVGAALRARWGLPSGVPLVGAMGRLSPEKRHDVFVDACGLVASTHPSVRFVLAGGGPLHAEVARRIAAAGLRERFHLLGVVDEPEELLAELAVVVQPSDVETTSRVVLEAMMQARPIVATDVGGTATLLRHEVSGMLVPPRDAARIAAEVTRLLDEPGRATRMGKAAREAALSGYDASTMAAGVDDVYRAVLGRAAELPGTWIRA
jgi:glycosyltransferase involved in cell wall biosynthesis